MSVNFPNKPDDGRFNPYSAPVSKLDDDEMEYNDSSFYATKGRIGRLRYLAYSVVLAIIAYAIIGFVMGILAATGLIEMTVLMMILAIPAFVGIFYAQFVPAIRRLNDLERSGWWSITLLIPYLNILTALYLTFAPGDDGYNEYGAPAYPPSTRVKVVALVVPMFAILGILAAIALPAYQDYVERSTATKIQQAIDSSRE